MEGNEVEISGEDDLLVNNENFQMEEEDESSLKVETRRKYNRFVELLLFIGFQTTSATKQVSTMDTIFTILEALQMISLIITSSKNNLLRGVVTSAVRNILAYSTGEAIIQMHGFVPNQIGVLVTLCLQLVVFLLLPLYLFALTGQRNFDASKIYSHKTTKYLGYYLRIFKPVLLVPILYASMNVLACSPTDAYVIQTPGLVCWQGTHLVFAFFAIVSAILAICTLVFLVLLYKDLNPLNKDLTNGYLQLGQYVKMCVKCLLVVVNIWAVDSIAAVSLPAVLVTLVLTQFFNPRPLEGIWWGLVGWTAIASTVQQSMTNSGEMYYLLCLPIVIIFMGLASSKLDSSILETKPTKEYLAIRQLLKVIHLMENHTSVTNLTLLQTFILSKHRHNPKTYKLYTFDYVSIMLGLAELSDVPDQADHTRKQKICYQFVHKLCKELRQLHPKSADLLVIHSHISKDRLKNNYQSYYLMRTIERQQAGSIYYIAECRSIRNQIEANLMKDEVQITEESGLSLAKIATFHKILSRLKHNLLDASEVLHGFWSEIQAPKPLAAHLIKSSSQAVKLNFSADKLYQILMAMSPSNIKLLRLYGNFISKVRGDHLSAKTLLAAAVSQARNLKKSKVGFPLTKAFEDLASNYGDNTNAGMVCASFNKQDFGHITYVTPELEVWTGFDRQNIIGANIDTIIPKSLASVHTDMMKRYFKTAEGRFGFSERILFPIDVHGFVAPSTGLLRVMPSLERGLEMVILMKPLQEDDYQKNGLAIVDQDGVLIGVNKAAWEKFKIPPAACYGNSLGETPLMLNNIFPDLPEGSLQNLVEQEELRTDIHPYLMGRRFRANNDLENLQKDDKKDDQKVNQSVEGESEVSMEEKPIQVKLKSLGNNSFYGGALVWKIFSITEEENHKAAVQPNASLANLRPPESYVTQVVKMTSLVDGDPMRISRTLSADLQKNSPPLRTNLKKDNRGAQEGRKKMKPGLLKSEEHSRTLRQHQEQSRHDDDSAEEGLARELSPPEQRQRLFSRLARRYSEKEAKSLRRLLGRKNVPRLVWLALSFVLAPLGLLLASALASTTIAAGWYTQTEGYLTAAKAVARYAGFIPYAAGIILENQLIDEKVMDAPTSPTWDSIIADLKKISNDDITTSHKAFMKLKSVAQKSGMGGSDAQTLFSKKLDLTDLGPNLNQVKSSPILLVAIEQFLAALGKVFRDISTTPLRNPIYFVTENGAGTLRATLLSAIDSLRESTKEKISVWGLVQDCLLVLIQFFTIYYTWQRLSLITTLQSKALDAILTIKPEKLQGILANIKEFSHQAEDAKNVIVEDKHALSDGQNSVEEDNHPFKEIEFNKDFNQTKKLDQIESQDSKMMRGDPANLLAAQTPKATAGVPAPVGEAGQHVPPKIAEEAIQTPPKVESSLAPLLLLLSSLLLLSVLLLARRIVAFSLSSNSSDLYNTSIRLWSLRAIVSSLPSQILGSSTVITAQSTRSLANRVYTDSSWLERLEVTSADVGLSEFGSFLVAFNGQQCTHAAVQQRQSFGCGFDYAFQATRFPTMLARLSTAVVDLLLVGAGDASGRQERGRAYRLAGVDEYVIRSDALLAVVEEQLGFAVSARLVYWRNLTILFEVLIMVFSCLLAGLAAFVLVRTYTDKIWQSKSMLNLVPSFVVQETFQLLELLFLSDFTKITH